MTATTTQSPTPKSSSPALASTASTSTAPKPSRRNIFEVFEDTLEDLAERRDDRVERIQQWLDPRPTTRLLLRVARTLLTYAALLALMWVTAGLLSIVLVLVVATFVRVGADAAPLAWDAISGYVFVSTWVLAAIFTVIGLRQLRWLPDTDRRGRHEAARELVEQALISMATGGHVDELRLGHVRSGRLFASERWSPSDISNLRRELIAPLTPVAEGAGMFPRYSRSRADDRRIARIVEVANELVVRTAIASRSTAPEGDIRATTEYLAVQEAVVFVREHLALVPDSLRQQIELELRRAGSVRGDRLVDLLVAAGEETTEFRRRVVSELSASYLERHSLLVASHTDVKETADVVTPVASQ